MQIQGKTISGDTINEIKTIALTVSSSWGSYPIHFIVVQDKQKIKDIARGKAMGTQPLHTAI